jgi:ribulose-5-phosphate 4-epimerase/fuculose-1-phosphate aldolase
MDYEKLFYSDTVQRIATTMCDIARECWRLGLSDSTGFSISARVPDSDAILVDKSGTGFRRNNITPEDLILYDIEGNLLYKSQKSENDRLAPVNTVIHLGGYRSSPQLQGCIHWHDPFTIAFAAQGKNIPPFSLQSKLIGEVPCLRIDDREEKKKYSEHASDLKIPTGIHTRPDVLYVMNQVADAAAQYVSSRKDELDKHGVVVTHYEHGLFSWGRSVDEAFENAYRSYRNAQAIIYSKLLS